MKKIFLIVVIFAFGFTSCKKNKDKATNCSATEANLVGKYKVASIKYKASASATEQDLTDQFLEACEKDDVTTIKSDHTYIYTDAGTVCATNGDYDGTWSLSSNTLTLDGDPGTLENFSCDGFTVFATDYQTMGDKISINYSKQ